MKFMGYVNMGELRASIAELCHEAGLEEVQVQINHPAKRGDGHTVIVEVVERQDVDPTEESNAVSWGDN